ncbi:phosphoglucosamine mutase [Aureispira anguillae]|uniref:phosphoglucosamine mutase n=1 Tax=Aureispira anguillae TaxID=2864201 RepID=UPI002230B1C0|nr:phosphoglucosamine mutase [Aureispira anguillae]
MALIKSISGTRGTIGGNTGDNFTAQDIVESTAAYAQWVLKTTQNPLVVVGRDARVSGNIVNQLVSGTLRMMGINVMDLGLSTTPTVEIAVSIEGAGGGIILTASHNPKQWNALKFLNSAGEFISAEDGQEILDFAASGEIEYATIDKLGSYEKAVGYIQKHIDIIFDLELVNTEQVVEKQYKVVVDCINSTGTLSIIPLLEQMGCEVIAINDEMHGRFAHNPEPLPQNLVGLAREVLFHKADLGIAVDPDVDRLAFVTEEGEMFGEEYTLVAIADYILRHQKGNTVSNLSSTQALNEVTLKHGGVYTASAVGEVNVVTTMKATNAIIGGEGNGGIIYPELHYGRDALVGVALFLSFMAESGKPVSHIRRQYPNYTIIKDKIQLTPEINIIELLDKLQEKYQQYPQNTIDGLKIYLNENWVHLRRSNTEPIIRIYTESQSITTAETLANKIKMDMSAILKGDI